MSESTDPMVAALLREREGYVRSGKADRVAAVDEQLKLRGYEVKEDADPRTEPPRKRQAPSQQTAEDSAKRATRPARRADQDAG